TLRFNDGSVIKVNGGSTLRYPENFSDSKREVYLEGEAFFTVAHDESKPFVIHTGDLTIRDLGTAFNVKAYKKDKEVQVAVTVGSVSISKNDSIRHSDLVDEQIILKIDQWAVYNELDGDFEQGRGDISDMIAWKDNILVFHETPFSEVARMLERWYGVKIVLKDKELGGMILEGKYDNVRLETVLESIQFVLGFEYSIETDKVKIKLPKNKKQKF